MEAGYFWTKKKKEDHQDLEQSRDEEQQQEHHGKYEGRLRGRMSQPSGPPRLNPQFCFNQRALRGEIFLVGSRQIFLKL